METDPGTLSRMQSPQAAIFGMVVAGAEGAPRCQARMNRKVLETFFRNLGPGCGPSQDQNLVLTGFYTRSLLTADQGGLALSHVVEVALPRKEVGWVEHWRRGFKQNS